VTRRRIVVATADTLTAKMAGPAIRAMQIAVALHEEHDVHLVTTSSCDIDDEPFPVSALQRGDMQRLEAWADVLIIQGYVMADHLVLRSSTKVIVVDLYDPIHLEQLEQAKDLDEMERRNTVHVGTEVLNQQLMRGDFFMCASEKQRDFWLGSLAANGRLNPAAYDADESMRALIDVVPFGVEPVPPVHRRNALRGVVPGIGADDQVILWGGGIYNWFDPLTLLRAVDKLRAQRPTVRLYFLGLRHPNPAVPTMRMAASAQSLAEELGLTGTHVFFNEGWVDYDGRADYLLEADIGVSTHLDNIETAFSFRTRVLDYIWAGLPVVVSGGDSLSVVVEEHGLGLVVPPGDVDALAAALDRLLADDAQRARCRAAAEALRPSLTWQHALTPLVDFCRNPRRAPDLVDADAARRLHMTRGRIPAPKRTLRDEAAAAARAFREGGLRRMAVGVADRYRAFQRRR
jgi:glycosyltransferase involved in cell wall biosynthesis